MLAVTDDVTYSRASIAKLEKALDIQPLVILHEYCHRICSADLYHPSSDAKFEERSFITDPLLISNSSSPATVMLFTPAPDSMCPALTDGNKSKMFLFRGFWRLSRDEAYVGTRRDWDIMPALARERITYWYGRARSEKVDLRESYLTRYKLTKMPISVLIDDDDFIEIGEEQQTEDHFSDSEGVTGSSL